MYSPLAVEMIMAVYSVNNLYDTSWFTLKYE